MKTSPGPWKFGYTDNLEHPIIVGANGEVVCVMHEGVSTEDGKLLAKAPLMLEALKLIASIENPVSGLNYCKDIAITALDAGNPVSRSQVKVSTKQPEAQHLQNLLQPPAAGDMGIPMSTSATVSDAQIKAVFLANGFTIKEGLTDLKPYVYQAARALLATNQKLQHKPRMKDGFWNIYEDLYKKGYSSEDFIKNKFLIADRYKVDVSDLNIEHFVLVCQAQAAWC